MPAGPTARAGSQKRSPPKRPHFYAEAILRKEPYRNPADLEHLAEGFKKAGLLTEPEPCEIAAEAARYYLTGRSPFIHGARGKPTFRATS